MDFGPEPFLVRLPDGGGMEPVFDEGDYIYVDPDERAGPGRYLGVRLGPERFAVRLLAAEDGRLVLRALDPGVPDVVLDASNETIILGVVVFRGRRP